MIQNFKNKSFVLIAIFLCISIYSAKAQDYNEIGGGGSSEITDTVKDVYEKCDCSSSDFLTPSFEFMQNYFSQQEATQHLYDKWLDGVNGGFKEILEQAYGRDFANFHEAQQFLYADIEKIDSYSEEGYKTVATNFNSKSDNIQFNLNDVEFRKFQIEKGIPYGIDNKHTHVSNIHFSNLDLNNINPEIEKIKSAFIREFKGFLKYDDLYRKIPYVRLEAIKRRNEIYNQPGLTNRGKALLSSLEIEIKLNPNFNVNLYIQAVNNNQWLTSSDRDAIFKILEAARFINRDIVTNEFLDKVDVSHVTAPPSLTIPQLQEMAFEKALDELGGEYKEFIKANPNLKAQVASTFKNNNYSEFVINKTKQMLDDYNQFAFSEFQGSFSFIRPPYNYEATGFSEKIFKFDYLIRANISDAEANLYKTLGILIQSNPNYNGTMIRQFLQFAGISIPNGLTNNTLHGNFYFTFDFFNGTFELFIRQNRIVEYRDLGRDIAKFLDKLKDEQGDKLKKPWYLDKDKDGYHSEIRNTVIRPTTTGNWISNTKGKDCNDNDIKIQKINSCGVCDSASASGFCCPKGYILDQNNNCIIAPCTNKDLRNKRIPDNVKNLISKRKQVVSSRNTESFRIQEIEGGTGDINIDRYTLNISKLPDGYSPQQLFEEIRTNFDNIVTGGNTPWEEAEFMPYASQDNNSWNSSNPIGSAMDFDTLMDTATVICTEYSLNEMYWTFTTVHSVDHFGHPVSGHRQFGLEENPNGGYTFVVRGADRLTTSIDYVANGALGAGINDFAFDLADSTWKNLMESIRKLVVEKPGAEVEHFNEQKTYGKRFKYNKKDCL